MVRVAKVQTIKDAAVQVQDILTVSKEEMKQASRDTLVQGLIRFIFRFGDDWLKSSGLR